MEQLQTEQFIQNCRKLVGFDTSTSESTVEAVNFLKQLALENLLHVEVIEEVQNGIPQANILVRTQKFQPGDQEFLLQTHLDTVEAAHFSLWKNNDFNPFDATIINGKIYGLGAAEVKLDFLCKLEAIKKFKNQNFTKMKPVIAGTFGEESGMQGALKLIRKNKMNAKFALIGEPSNLKIIHAAKGFATVEIRIPFSNEEKKYRQQKNELEQTSTQSKIFSGKSTHSSTPQLGDNAIDKLFSYLQKLPENLVIIDIDGGTRFNTVPNQAFVEFEISADVHNLALKKINHIYSVLKQVEAEMIELKDTEFEPHHSTLSIGIVRTTDDYILLGGSCRILPNITQDIYEKWMNKIKLICEEHKSTFQITDYKKPFRTSDSSILIKTAQNVLKKMNLDPNCLALASTNEASLFSRLGIDCICFGAGCREGNMHTAEEHVKIEDLVKSIEFYQQMIERLCL